MTISVLAEDQSVEVGLQECSVALLDVDFYLAANVELAIHHNVVWQANVDMVDAMPIPRDHWLVSFKFYSRIKSREIVDVEVGDEIINQQPPKSLRRHLWRLIRWLTGPSDGIPDVFPAIAR